MAKKGTFPANAMRRGEIYWVDIPNAIGHELMKDRPAIIVSCDALNDNSPVVQVVYCSASPKKELPEHITIRSTEQISTALCENVYTVDKSRVGRFVGRCTRRELRLVRGLPGRMLQPGELQGGERLMTEPKDLCGRCAAMLQEGYDLKRVGGGVDHKVTCSHCGRRRYGATYTIEKHSKSKA